ncbi:helix-turn-helix domain-containing protein [Pseudonocardia sp. Ae150A_Ps1]
MRDAAAAGVSQVELAELTGYHRNTIRRILDGDPAP